MMCQVVHTFVYCLGRCGMWETIGMTQKTCGMTFGNHSPHPRVETWTEGMNNSWYCRDCCPVDQRHWLRDESSSEEGDHERQQEFEREEEQEWRERRQRHYVEMQRQEWHERRFYEQWQYAERLRAQRRYMIAGLEIPQEVPGEQQPEEEQLEERQSESEQSEEEQSEEEQSEEEEVEGTSRRASI